MFHANRRIPNSFSVLFVLDPFNFDVVGDQLVHVSDDGRTLNVHEDEGRDNLHIDGIVSASSRAGIDVEFILMLVRLEFVRMARDEDVHVELALDES